MGSFNLPGKLMCKMWVSAVSTPPISTLHPALTHFTHPLSQTWPLCQSLTIFGQGVRRWSTDVNLSVTEGQDTASSSSSPSGAVCPRRADVLSLQGVQRSAQGPCLPLLEITRRSEIPQICRQPEKPECKLLTSAAPQKPRLSRANCVWGCAQRTYCLRLAVNRSQSQQARLQWHIMAVSLVLKQTHDATLHVLTPSTQRCTS